MEDKIKSIIDKATELKKEEYLIYIWQNWCI